ncbi:hypothetical protein ACTXT7_004358 [Hymenolepis weldensis]
MNPPRRYKCEEVALKFPLIAQMVLNKSNGFVQTSTRTKNEVVKSPLSQQPSNARKDVSSDSTRRSPSKLKAKRCASCNRKTGLADSYTCRCERNFCAKHRYAELHDCPFDYKAEARRVIQETNPVVTAAKLPKI